MLDSNLSGSNFGEAQLEKVWMNRADLTASNFQGINRDCLVTQEAITTDTEIPEPSGGGSFDWYQDVVDSVAGLMGGSNCEPFDDYFSSSIPPGVSR